MSRAPIEKLDAYKQRMGWTIPWVSSYRSDFNVDFGVGPEKPQAGVYQDGESFGLSIFLRDGDNVFRTYFTTHRGVEALGSVWTFLDLTPLGRQEEWEDSPKGYPQTKPYSWWRRHDEYRVPRFGGPDTRLRHGSLPASVVCKPHVGFNAEEGRSAEWMRLWSQRIERLWRAATPRTRLESSRPTTWRQAAIDWSGRCSSMFTSICLARSCASYP